MNIPLYGDENRKLFGNMATLFPSAQDSPNMTIKITAGGFWCFMEGMASYIEYVGGSSPAISSPVANAKWVIVSLNHSGMVVNIDGPESAHPVLPTLPANRYPIALVYVNAGDIRLTNEFVFDARPIFQNTVRDHMDLMNRDFDGSHPINAITGLSDTINGLVPMAEFDDRMADKADVGGTPSASFKLNQNHTGTPSSDAVVEVERGSANNVYIRWNESTDAWEYTNDGIVWIKFVDYYLNNGSTDLVVKSYAQGVEPTLDVDNKLAIWKNTGDMNKIFLVFRRGVGDQVKVELT